MQTSQSKNASKPISSGVDELIARLHEEGVAKGVNEADVILSDARAEAKRIIDSAKAQAQQQLENARKQADAYKTAGEEALKTAMRDMVLELKIDLTKGFSTDVKRLVSHQLQNPEVLKQMILEVAGRARASAADAKAITILLPIEAIGLEALRNNPAELETGPLTEFVFGLTREMLQQGVSFSASEDITGGIKVQLQEQNIVLDLTEQAVADLLLQHLQPRFRAILEGVVR